MLHEKLRGRKGFTLAELLLIVAIIGLLVSVAIPVMGNVVVDSKDSVCYSTRCALKAELAMGNILGDFSGPVSKTPLDGLLAKEYHCPSGGTLFYEISSEGSVTVTCSVHQGEGGDTVKGVNQLGLSAIAAAIKNSVYGKVVDSEAISGQNTAKTALLKEFKDQGIDLEGMGIKSWRVWWDGSQKGDARAVYEFSTVDINDLSVGAKVPVIRYRPYVDPNQNSYTMYSVWEATVTTETFKDPVTGETKSYKIISGGSREYSGAGKTNANLTFQQKWDLDTIIGVYNDYNGAFDDVATT